MTDALADDQTDELAGFRRDARQWLEENCPSSMRTPSAGEADIVWGGRNASFSSEDQKVWMERMAERGWTVPTWPQEYGGGGLSKAEGKALMQEMKALGCRNPLYSFGIHMLGPALLKYGNEEQKKKYLPEIIRGEIRWCQGYSEPGAGSDLASLKTKAEDKGDHYLVNGQKVWTSYADQSDWIFCLVRTDFDAPKHNGISFLLIDMESPGVSTKPIKLISGRSPFCETFFDDVKVPKENLVGEAGRGWDIAKYLLTHEREMIGGLGFGLASGIDAAALAKETSGIDGDRVADPILRAEIAALEIDAAAFAATMERIRDEAKAGQGTGAASSMLKYYGTELNKRRQELLMRIAGSDGLEWEGERSNDGAMPRAWLRSRANSIEGGTSEIQLNIIAKRILELPGQ